MMMTSSSIRLLVVSGHHLFRQCLASLLSTVEDYDVRDHDLELSDVVLTLRNWQPAVVLLDFPCSRTTEESRELEVIREMGKSSVAMKLLLMGVDELHPDVLECIETGAQGYISRDSSLDDLRQAIKLLKKGGAVCPPRLAYSMFLRLGELSRACERAERVEALKLTPRELEILQLIAEGYSNKKIAEALFISVYTVKNHVHHILEKLQVGGRTEAVQHALERRWITDRRFAIAAPRVRSAASMQDAEMLVF